MGGNLSFNEGDDIQLKGATDGTLIGNISTSLRTIDVSNASGVQAAITVGTSALIANTSGAANLALRRNLTVYNNGSVTIYWGYTNAVTTSTGTPIVKNQFFSWDVGPSTSIYLISGSASQNVRVTENA